MNNFLKTRQEVEDACKYLADNELISSGLSCKNWEAVEVIPYLKDGQLLDMGSSGSVVLDNAVRLKIEGRKVGIDLAYTENVFRKDNVELYKMDLMKTEFHDNSFDMITCLSVLEHAVSFDRFAKESSRLLRVGGKLYVSFDYWELRLDTSKMKLYSLDWNILSREDVINLVYEFVKNGLYLTGDVDWALQEAVINPQYCSPADVSYTFGILEFIKK